MVWGRLEDVLHAQYGNINKYQNYKTCNGTYGMLEIFTFVVDTLREPVGVTGL